MKFRSVQSLSRVLLFANPGTAARQASLSITNFRSLLKLMSIESVVPSNYLFLCCPLLLSPSIFLSIRVFSNESALRIRWPKDLSFSFSISPSNEHPGLISFRMDWLDLLAVSSTSSNTTVQKHQFFGAQLSLWSNSHIHTWKTIALARQTFVGKAWHAAVSGVAKSRTQLSDWTELNCVLLAAYKIFSCGMQTLSCTMWGS